MGIFICLDCGKQFDKPITYYNEILEHFGTPCQESHEGCPECGSDYDESVSCDACGGLYPRCDLSIIAGKSLCVSCQNDYYMHSEGEE